MHRSRWRRTIPYLLRVAYSGLEADLQKIKMALKCDNDKFLDGYRGKLSTLMPILDFMNHNPRKKDTCTRPIATSEISADGLTLEFRTGKKALETGEELFYC